MGSIEQISTRRLLEEFGPTRPRHIPPAPRPPAALPRPREAWETLRRFFTRTEAATEATLERELIQLKQKTGESLPEYWQRAVTLRMRYENSGGVITNRSWRAKLMLGLPAGWNIFRVARAEAILNMEEGDLLAAMTEEANRQLDQAGQAHWLIEETTDSTGQANWGANGPNKKQGRNQQTTGRPAPGAYPRPNFAWGDKPKILGKDGAWGKLGPAPPGYCHGCHEGPGIHTWTKCPLRKNYAVPDFIKPHTQDPPRGPTRYPGWTGTNNQGRTPPRQPGRVNFASDDDDISAPEPGRLLACMEGTCSATTAQEDGWWMDSGASHHYTHCANDFTSPLEPPTVHTVRVGDGRLIPCTGKGLVQVKGHKGQVMTLQNVHLVPDLHIRLLSIPSICSNGLDVHFTDKKAEVSEKGNIYIQGAKPNQGANSLFLADIIPFPRKGGPATPPQARKDGPTHPTALMTEACGTAWITTSSLGPLELAHQRMGHASARTITNMAAKQTVQGLPTIPNNQTDMQPCTPCLLGKATRLPFPAATAHTSTHPLDLVHADVWGPVRIPTRGGKGIYVLNLLDDYTSYVWSFILTNKASITIRTAMEDWYIHTKTQAAPHSFTTFRCDGGSEFQGEVADWLRDTGITRQYSAPYTPQQNGRIERWHRTMAEGIRTLLLHSGLPTNFWGEALRQVVWIKNRTTHRALPDNSTPYEEWTGLPADVTLARVWGCMGCVFLPDPELQKEGKLGTKGVMCVCLGIDPEYKAWRMWDPTTQNIRISRHVEFLEHTMWKTWQKERKGGTSDDDIATEEDVLTFLPLSSLPTEEEPDNLGTLGSEVIRPGPRRSERVRTRADINAGGIPEVPLEENEPLAAAQERPAPKPPAPAPRAPRPQEPPAPAPTNPEHHRNAPKDFDYVVALGAPGAPSAGDYDLEDPAMAMALTEVLAAVGSQEPITVSEALKGPQAELWKRAIAEEMGAMAKFGVWDPEPVQLPPGGHAVDSKLIFRIKTNEAGEAVRYKARFVARGFTQRYGEDYDETFSSVAKMADVRLLLALAAIHNLDLHVVDVDNAFLNATLDDDPALYLQQPKGADDGTGRVFRLRKALYGLKQAPRVWNEELGRHLAKAGFKRAHSDDAMYLLWTKKGGFCFIPTWVDDLLIVSNSMEGVNSTKAMLKDGFSIKDLGEVGLYLGMQIHRDRTQGIVEIGLSRYIDGLATKFSTLIEGRKVNSPMSPDSLSKIRMGTGLTKGETEKTPQLEYMSILGCLMYAATTCRPDISFTISTLAQFSKDPRVIHLEAVARALRYLVQTKHFVLRYNGGDDHELKGYTDSDWGSEANGQSRNSFVFKLAGGAISWQTKKLNSIADSTTVAEYKALSTGAKEAIWFRQLLEELGLPPGPILMHTDSQAALSVAKDASLHQRTKHIRIVWHTIRQALAEGEINIKWIPTTLQVADGLTKALQGAPFQTSRQQLGLMPAAICAN